MAQTLSGTPTDRYFPQGTRKYYFHANLTSYPSAPTRAELNAATDLSPEIAEVSGFTVSSDTVEVPDLVSRFTATIPGKITAEDSSITFYLSSDGVDVRTVLPRDTAGYIICLPEGEVVGQKCDVFPVKVSSASIQPDVTEAGRIEIAFSITREPKQNLTIPA